MACGLHLKYQLNMTVRALADQANLKLLLEPAKARGEVVRLFASNTMSELIANAGGDTLLVTSLNNSQIVRVAELMEAPGICLVDGAAPRAELLAGAKLAGTAILVSQSDLETTRRALERRLREAGAGGR